MRFLTLSNLKLALDNLLDVKAPLLATSQMGVSYKPLLEAKRARVVRQATLKLVNNCRVAVRDEVEGNAGLPRNLEALLFGYFDELAERREENAGGMAGDGE